MPEPNARHRINLGSELVPAQCLLVAPEQKDLWNFRVANELSAVQRRQILGPAEVDMLPHHRLTR